MDIPPLRRPALTFQSQGAKRSQGGGRASEATARGYDPRQWLCSPRGPSHNSALREREGGIVRAEPRGLDPDEICVITCLEPGSVHTGMGVYLPFASLRGAIINAYKTL